MTIFSAFILGIVEGISEFLPISSTGHLILASGIMKIPQTEFVKTFEIAIQLGAILSVVVLYWRSFFVKFEVLKRVLAAFLPAAIIGFIFYKTIKAYLLGNSSIVVWALFLGGIFLILFELFHPVAQRPGLKFGDGRGGICSSAKTGECHRPKEDAVADVSSISYKQAVLIGVFQSLAIVPGVSRSAATIIGGLMLGLRRTAIVEFSFLLAVPTMLAATLLDLYKNAGLFTQDQFSVLAVGFVTSFIVAIIAIKFLLYFVKNHSFILFGIYRIAAAISFWLFLK